MERFRLQHMLEKAASAVQDNEKFPTGVLAVRANRIAEEHPTDPTVVGMSNFLRKKAESDKLFISRAEFKDAYRSLYYSNNKFAEHFAEELDLKEDSERVMKRDPREGESLMNEAYDKVADKSLAGALNSYFDPEIPYQSYSNDVAKLAQQACAHGLNKIGCAPKTVDVVAGRPDVLLCKASYDTPKGLGSVLVPIEIKSSKALMPSMFLAKEGFLSLEASHVEGHLNATAGKNMQADTEKILNLISLAKNGVPETLSEVELIVLRAQAMDGSPDQTNAVYSEVLPGNTNLELPSVDVPEEVQRISESLALDTSAGVAEFAFGKTAVDQGRAHISQELKRLGYKNSRIAVSDVDDNTIIYSVAIDQKNGFNVPVDVKNRTALYPSMIVSSQGLGAFSYDGIQDFLNKRGTDHDVLAKTSPLYGTKPSELIESIRTAMLDKNYLKAEDALSVLKTSGDDKAYQYGFDLYSHGLSDKLEKPAEITCSQPIKVSYSQHLYCSHCNLPAHQVFQDKHGNCQPAYRKAMDSSYEGASFLHSKIYWD